ncbi:MAG: hypothetical protein IJT21_01550 [Synergistaceae bacterium]|nr:hypothetical protein [Synergistaceae bacterium]
MQAVIVFVSIMGGALLGMLIGVAAMAAKYGYGDNINAEPNCIYCCCCHFYDDDDESESESEDKKC